MSSWVTPTTDIQRLPKSGPYQSAPRTNPAIVAASVARSDTAGILDSLVAPLKGIGQRDFGCRSEDRRPFAHTPVLHQAVDHVGVVLGKLLGGRRRGSSKEQYRAVRRIGQGAAKHQVATRDRLTRMADVRR